MRTLGVDPGSRVTGYGVVDGEGTRLECVACGVIRPRPGPLVDRLAEIHRGIQLLLEQFRPDQVVLEAVFAARNVRSALVLGQARGAALAACGLSLRGDQIAEYTPAEIKAAVTGNGRAPKEQVQHMVELLLGLRRRPGADAADALAVAICHLQQLPLRRAIAAAQPGSDADIDGAGASAALPRTRRGRKSAGSTPKASVSKGGGPVDWKFR